MSLSRVHTEVRATELYQLEQKIHEVFGGGVRYIRALFDTRKYIAFSAWFRRSLLLLARSLRSKSLVGPFVERSEMMRKALYRG